MPTPQSDFDREMRTLESEIKRLEAEYNMFFAGRLPRLPWERRARLEALVRSYDRAETRNTADLFRFQTLQARFVKLLELWERQLREREGGRGAKGARGRAAAEPPALPPDPTTRTTPPEAPPAASASRAEALPEVVKFKRDATEADRIKELYERVAEARKAVGESPMAYERIAALVDAQLKKHKDGHEVAFRVAVKDGKVQLSVKPDKD